jgi:hypothetical protein
MDDILENPHNLYTPKELLMLGGTFDRPTSPEDWDVPLAVKLGVSPEELSARRAEQGTFTSFVLAGALKDSGKNAVVNLEDLDPETGATKRDPRIGVIKEINEEKRFVEIPEWSRSVRSALSEMDQEVVWRGIEGQPGVETRS